MSAQEPELPSGPFEYPPDSPEEAYLRDQIDAAQRLFGGVHHFDRTTLSVDTLSAEQKGNLGVPPDAIHVSVPSYERTDHSIYQQDMGSFEVTVIGRDRYWSGEVVEPHRLSLWLRSVSGNAGVELRVQSRHFEGVEQPNVKTGADEELPTAMRIQTPEGTSIETILQNFLADLDPKYAHAFSFLATAIRQPFATEQPDGFRGLTPTQKRELGRFVQSFFFPHQGLEMNPYEEPYFQ